MKRIVLCIRLHMHLVAHLFNYQRATLLPTKTLIFRSHRLKQSDSQLSELGTMILNTTDT